MKLLNLILLGGLTLGFFSCKDDGKTKTAESGMAAKNLEANHAVEKAIATGDVSTLDAYITEDCVDHAGENGDIIGRDSIKAMMAKMHTYADNMKSETLKEFADDNNVIQWVRWTGTSKVAWGNMPSGTNYDMTAVHVMRMKDGKIAEHWEFMQMSDMMKMMGPPPPPAKAE